MKNNNNQYIDEIEEEYEYLQKKFKIIIFYLII